MNAFEVVQPRPVRGGWSLRGYKGKGGGGGARQPVEAADSLHSTSYARVLDLLSEGEIAGLVNGLQSIYLNNTPLANADGSFNFAGVTADFRAGFQTQDPIPGFPSTESPAAVGVELKAATPWVRSILNRNLSAVRVTLGVDGLSKANTENGDISGHTVNYAIDLQTDGGAWVEVLAAAFTGKTTQQYRRTHRIDLPTAVTSWTLRVRRITPNANSNTVADTTVIESITEVIDAKLRYPMSALVGLQVDASQFRGSVPTRAYHCRGRIIRVPSNYDPVMRSYAGIWDGTFKSAYSNNPAWVFYDLATNDRYGLGKRIPAGWINKWSLYQIGVYCDGMVSNGRGGVEPRFTCNAYLQSRGDATRVLQDLCSIFRGMVYWAAGAAVPVADMPRDPAVTYSQADVIDGRFSYSGSRLKDRHTVALVSYNDMTDFGRQKVFPYQDDAAVARYGIRKVEISAFGCTSEAQAQRVGQWAVLTAQRETRSVSFSLGLKGTLCSPGQVIEIADSAFAGRRMGGLVKSATAAKVVLDAPVTARAGDSITVMLPSGVAQSRRIAYLEMIDGAQHVSVNPAFDAAPVTESSWAISTANVATQLFTVLSVTEGTGPGLTFDVSAIQHEPGKFAAIDQGALLPERPVSVVPAQVLPTPIGVTVGAHSVTAGDGTVSTTVTAAWQAVAGAAFYDVEWSRSQSDWVRMPRTALTVLDIPNAYTGDYLVRVRAISAIDTVSAWGYSAATTVAAKALPPRNYDTFMVAEMPSGMRQYIFTYNTQRPPADLAGAEIRYILGSPVNIDWQQMRPLDDGGYYTNSFESTKPEAGLWTFALRARSRSGVLSEGMLIWRGQLLHNVADVVPDLTPPPAPTGVTAVPLMTTAQVNWASPTYTVGHGHDHSVIYAALWAAGGTAPAFSAAKSVGTEQGHPASIPVELGSKYTIWVTHVSVDGVESAPSVGITFETAQDVGKLLKVLAGKVGVEQFEPIVVEKIDQIDLIDFDRIDALNDFSLEQLESVAQVDLKRLDLIDFDRIGALNDFSLEQLESVAQVDLKRLDLIDVEGGPLGKSLVTAAAQQDALNQQVRGNMEDMAKGLLEAALAADAALERITDAGVYVDPATGQVKIYGLETTKTQVTNLEVLLDALSGQLQLKASTAYVDGRIAEAVLSPADLLLYEGLDARLINVVQQLDSINGTLSSKAEALELQNAVARLTTAESNLDALGAQIALRVTRAEYEAAQDALQTRLGSAELTLSALDVPAITATVTAVSKLQRESDKTAQALLQDILNGEYNRVQAQDALAFARNQLSASIQEGLAAEAAARTQLAATVDHQAAALELESVTRATADAAEASQRQALAATVQGNYQQTTAAIEAEQAARVDGDAAEAAQREALRAQMQGETDTLAALLEEEALTRATADSAEATARQQLAAQLQQADSALGAQVTDERNARIAADEAEAAARTALAARLDGKDSDLAAQVTAEQSARVAGDAAEALARQQLATRLDGVDASLSSQITNEQSARSAGDAAEATARQQLAARLDGADGALGAQVTEERAARIAGDAAEATARQQLATQVSGNQAAALAAAQAAADAAGAKGKVLYQSATPAAADQLAQNLWIDTKGGANTPKRWNGSAWAAVTDKVATDAAAAAAAAAQSASEAKAQITQESQARATAIAAEALARQQLATRLDGVDASLSSQITNEQSARSAGDAAEATARQQLAAAVEQAQSLLQAQITAEATARVDGDLAETSERESQISASRALSQKESERTAQALLQDILTGERNKKEAQATLALAKTELATQIQEGLSAEALQRTQLAAMVDGQKAALEEESRVRADNDAAESATRAALAAQVQRGQEQTQAQIQEERQARADADAAEAAARQQLAAKVQTDQEAIQSQITAESQSRATAIAAEATQREQLAAIVGDNHAAVQQQFTAQAGINGYLAAKYSLAVQVGSGGQVVVGGMQITGTADGEAGPKIAIAFATDAFSIVAPDGSRKAVPFYVQTSDMTINGVPVPAGVYMDSARIGNVEALFGRFGSLFADKVQATAISASQLTAGNGVIGGSLKSSNYVAGSSGWILRPDGMAEFSGVTVRGTIYSTAGTIGGITINGNGLNSGGFWGYVWPPAGQSGFHIGPNGILLGNANNGRYVEIQSSGNIYAPGLRIENGNATFSGNLSGASGTFSGTLTAQRVISMENLDYNIATVAVGVTAGDQVSPINGEILGVTAPAADWSATYIVSFHADVRAGSRGVLQIQVDGGTQFEFSLSEGGMKSFGFTFSGNGLTRRVRLYVAGNNTAPVSSVIARSISVIVSKR